MSHDEATTSLLAREARVCPYPTYERLRAEEPVRYLPDQDIWILTRYDDVEYVLRNPRRFSSKESPSSTNAYRHFPRALEILAQSRAVPRARTLMLADLPEHKRYRAAAHRALQAARTLREFTPRISALCDELIDGFCEQGRCEIVGSFSTPLPMALVAYIFDVPPEWTGPLKAWSDSFFTALSGYVGEEEVVRAAHHTLEFEDFVLDRIAERRVEHVDDFLGRLIRPGRDADEGVDGGAELTDSEIVNMCSQVLVGGNESSTNMLSNLVHLLATTEGLADTLRVAPEKIPAFVEEALRLEAPLQAMYRITRHDEDFDGVVIPPGSKLMLNFGSANRDEAYYADGENLDVERDNSETVHLSFGRGIHSCMGQSFARCEGVVAVEKLVDRLPDLRLAATAPEPAPLFGVRGFRSLDVEFTPTPRLAQGDHRWP